MTRSAPADPAQRAFDELGDPLREVTFVVVDLETTGGSPAADAITEFGAVKVRGGEVLGEFATLVDPGRPVPPQIVRLTGITDAMVHDAPRIDTVLPAFLEFAHGCVWVAHNARFDMGFLRAGCQQLDLPWPHPPVVDTVRLARSVLSREEMPSVRLSVLAPALGATVSPDHRALHDARATVDVLHALFERLGPLGVVTLQELSAAAKNVDPQRRRKRHLAAHLPRCPGVYLFRGSNDEVLYVGTSGNLHARVQSYFTAAETRSRMRHMVMLATRVDHVECSTTLEAQIREQRLIATHLPPYNRRSRSPRKTYWVRLTDETFPRLSLARTPPDATAVQVGPFGSMASARRAQDALQAALPLRACTQRLPRAPRRTPCALYELGACGAPCAGKESAADYAEHVRELASLAAGRSDAALETLAQRLQRLAADGHFAQAARARDDMETLIAGLMRYQDMVSLASIAEVVAAQPDQDGGWTIAVIRFGRLAAAGRARRGVDPMPVVEFLRSSAETVLPGPGALPAASAEETRTILGWLARPGTRLVLATDGWAQPAHGAGRWASFAAAARAARAEYDRTESG